MDNSNKRFIYVYDKLFVEKNCLINYYFILNFQNHNYLHTGQRPYTCPFCSRTFANGSNCRSHKRRMHPEELRVFESSSENTQKNDDQKTSEKVDLPSPAENGSTISNKKLAKTSILNFSSENVADTCDSGQTKSSSPTLSTNNFPSFLPFSNANDQRYSPIKESSSVIRSSLSQHFSLEYGSHSYSPCHEEDLSSSAIIAYPSNTYVNQSFLFNRNGRPS